MVKRLFSIIATSVPFLFLFCFVFYESYFGSLIKSALSVS